MHERAIQRIAFLLIAVTALVRPSAADDELARRINKIVDAPEFKHAHWGVLVADLATGETLYEQAADKLFAPASTTKLYSVAAALDALGADYRFETPIYARGDMDKEGRLQGDLVLVASGDLTMGGRTDEQGHITFTDSDHTYANFSRTAELTAPHPLAGLEELARQVAGEGVKRVTGDVLVDDSLFDTASGTGSGPGKLTPILINDNCIDVRIAPSKPGAPATVEWRPKSAVWRVDAQVDTVAADGETRVELTSPADGVIVVRGQIPAAARPIVRIHEVSDAAAFARALLIEALRRAVITVDASPLVANDAGKVPDKGDYAKLRRMALLRSPPFSESARLVLKVSHNLHASTLPLLVAAHNGERTLSAGLKRQHDFLARVGVDVNTISFGGGAGGDRADYVSPRATVQLLRYMATRPDFDVYCQALPVLGVDGTLAKAVDSGSPARGKVQAKTGTLLWSNVMNGNYLLNSKALAGYATGRDQRRLAFAMFVNQTIIARHDDLDRVGKLLGSLCEAIVSE
ncbi:MAG: D-alanyl-D-alanine carboxypeptidase/D-alanyl-D-alanine-endopeptidase [Planctomycetia bacterium]|nr:D-alanyl-D-alanine carboxypeptidase/D-alanyl-D-alanine-endopeptidase [Planctomycetia bacterium]